MFGQNYGLTQCYNYIRKKEHDKYIPMFNNVGVEQLIIFESLSNLNENIMRRNIKTEAKHTSQELIKYENLVTSYLSDLTNFTSLLNNNKIQKLIIFLAVISVFLELLSIFTTVYSNEVEEYLNDIFKN